MKNKGFTLIELLGVIVILSIISLITIPVIDSSLNQGKSKLSELQKQQIIKGLKNYYADQAHLSEFNSIVGEECKSVESLKAAGYLPANIEDPKNGEDFNVAVCVKKEGNKYTYFIQENSGD